MNGGAAKVESAFSIVGLRQTQGEQIGGRDIDGQHGLQQREGAGVIRASIQVLCGFGDDRDVGVPGYEAKNVLAPRI